MIFIFFISVINSFPVVPMRLLKVSKVSRTKSAALSSNTALTRSLKLFLEFKNISLSSIVVVVVVDVDVVEVASVGKMKSGVVERNVEDDKVVANTMLLDTVVEVV